MACNWMRPQGSNLLGTSIKSAPAVIIWARGTLNFATPRALSGYFISNCSSCFSIGFLPAPWGNWRMHMRIVYRLVLVMQQALCKKMRETTSMFSTYEDYDLNILFDKMGNGFYQNIWTFLLFKPTNETYDRDVSVHWQSHFCLEGFFQQRLCISHLSKAKFFKRYCILKSKELYRVLAGHGS